MNTIELKILDKEFYKEFSLPEYATTGSAGLDLRANLNTTPKPSVNFGGYNSYFNAATNKYYLYPNENILFSTGIAINIGNPGIAAIISPRSGLGHKYGINLGNTIGLIDSDYQGELFVSLVNRSAENYVIQHGDKIAQMFFVPIIQVEFNVVETFHESERGIGGFGSTGK
jgi:deoxyuridine 5'-triphosphate nucleotidohydrolase